MKKWISGIALFLCFAVNVNAQGLLGTYNVGDGGDYISLKAAFDDLMAEGVSGDVTFLITTNLTETENVFLGINPEPHTITIKPAPGEQPVVSFTSGTSNTNINGALVLGATGDDDDLLTVTRNIVIDGSNTVGGTSRDLTFRIDSGANSSNYFRIAGAVKDSQIKNAVFETLNDSFDTWFISAMEPGEALFFPDNLEIVNNKIINNPTRSSGRAVNIWGQFSPSEGAKNTIIKGNDLEARRYGIWLRQDAESTTIENNTIQVTETGTATAFGVLISDVVNPSDKIVIKNNTIHGSEAQGNDFSAIRVESPAVYEIAGNTFENLSATGLLKGIEILTHGSYTISANEFINFNGDSGIEIISTSSDIDQNYTLDIVNNFMTGFGSTGGNGENLYGVILRSPVLPALLDVKMYHNSIRMNPISISGTGWNYRALFVFSNPRITTDLKNNIFINDDNNGTAVTSYAYFQGGSAAADFNSDFNLWHGANLSVGDNTYLSSHAGGDATTLSEHQTNTGQDANSVSKSVEFVDAATGNLRLTGTSNGDQDLAGTPLSEVTTDIDDEPRNPNNPYMGAFEGRPLSPMVVIRGDEGWRFMSSPTNETYATLLDPIWTQGATGSDDPGSDAPNVYEFNGTDYVAIDNLTDPVSPGSGFAVYVFGPDEHNNPDSINWPKVLTLSGTQNTGTVTAPINAGVDTYSLVGNPFFSAIEFSELTTNDIRNQVFVYTHDSTGPFDQGDDETVSEEDGGGGWRTWNGTAGSLTDGKIAPFQGFFVRNTETATSPSLQIPEGAQISDEVEFFNVPQQKGVMQIAARINQSQQADVWFSFTDNGSVNLNEKDVPSLFPLDFKPFLSVFAEAGGQSLDIKNLPAEITGELNVPLHIYGWQPDPKIAEPAYIPLDGTVEIIWPVFEHIPHEWDVFLVDHETGAQINMRESDGYLFAVNTTKTTKTLAYELALASPDVSEKSSSRFSLRLSPQATSTPGTGDLPQSVTLAQNYPNPFNPVTVISYELPVNSMVTLDVYNITGQRVASLVREEQTAGTHQINFDGSGLASGMYIYRLKAENTVLTRKMTLVK